MVVPVDLARGYAVVLGALDHACRLMRGYRRKILTASRYFVLVVGECVVASGFRPFILVS